MKKTILTLISIFLIATGAVFAENVVIEAKKQEIKVDQNKGFFNGDVKVTVGDVTVKSPRAELDLDPNSKKPSLAVFYDNPYAFQNKDNKKHEIKSRIMKVSLIKKTILAEGDTQSIMLKDRQPVITINADMQQYDTNTKLMRAKGGVIVHYNDVETFSEFASAIVDKEGSVKNLKLEDNVVIKEGVNILKGNKFEYIAPREEYYLTGNTSSDLTFDDGTRLFVKSRYQQYNRLTNNVIAGGDVKVNFKDYFAQGPKAQLFVDSKTNKPKEVIFTGRSKITQNGSTVEADRIRMTMEPKEFFADGNVKTSIQGNNGSMEIMP
ncbi:MAG: hypothetical protein LUE64_03300 [Candidatus Gastranaerophilales bacterium]|nr:hypothetical protein [Candidatus Gastranaerophilales bacterium]